MSDWYNIRYRTPQKCKAFFCRLQSRDRGKIRSWKRVWHSIIGDYRVFTSFLGLDHSYDGGPPLLFETMITFKGEWQNHQTRCSTWRQALAMHLKAKKIVKEGRTPDA